MTTYDMVNIMIPSYRRKEMLNRCIQSALDTAQNICFTICVNNKDMDTFKFIENFPYSRICAIFEDTSQPNLSLYYNRMYALTPWKNALVSMIGDDMVFETANWDLALLDEFNAHQGERVIYCNDGDRLGEKMCVNLFTTRKVVEAQQMPFMCERYHADMIDFIWFLTASYTSTIQYRSDIVIDHRHTRGMPEKQWDETYKRLAPLQDRLKNDGELEYAIMYASICAANLIKKGIGINPREDGNRLFQKNMDFVAGRNTAQACGPMA